MSTGNNRKPAAKIGGGFQTVAAWAAINEFFRWGSANDYRKEINYFLRQGQKSKHYKSLRQSNRSNKRFSISKVVELITILEGLIPDPFAPGTIENLSARVKALEKRKRR